jgi:prepilin-type N-terminal cleavage/methylation domain-containing protein
MRHTLRLRDDARGSTLAELMIALVILSIGLLAVAQLFPAGARGQSNDRMMTIANYYAQESIERLGELDWSHPDLVVGRHPAGTATESLGTTGAWKRFYVVAAMAAPLDNLKKVTVTVTWKNGTKSVTATTYYKR